MERLFAGPQGPADAGAAAAGAAAAGGGAAAAGGGTSSKNVLSFKGWTLDMLQASAARCQSLLAPGTPPPWPVHGWRCAVLRFQLPASWPHLPALRRRMRTPAAQAACVLAGSDFLPSLKGISFKTAAGFVGRRRSLGAALKAIRLEKRFQLACTQVGVAAAVPAELSRLGDCSCMGASRVMPRVLPACARCAS